MAGQLNEKRLESSSDIKDVQIIKKDDDSNPYNKIISKNVSEYHFIVPNNELVELGEIFSIQDEEKDITFLARTTDIQHASNYDGNWDTIIRGNNFYDKDHIFNRVVSEPLGCIIKEGREEKFRKSRTIPTKFSSVWRADKTQFQFLVEVMGDIEVGHLRNGSKDVSEIPVALHSEAMDHHIGVFATTGMGKSNFMKVFAASCMKKVVRGDPNFGLLIVDPHGEYVKGKKRTPGLLDLESYREGLVCYSTDPEHLKDPLIRELVIREDEIRPSDIKILHDWSSAQKLALNTASRVFPGGTWMEEIQTPQGIARMLDEEDFDKRTIGRINTIIKNILDENNYIQKMRSSVSSIISHLLEGKVVLVDIPNLSEQSELFLLSLISRRILERYKKESSEGSRGKRCLITIEEAQRVLGGGEGSLYRFESIAREGRKFGVGRCAVTQQPKLIDKQLLSQFNTFVILGLADRNDRTRLEESAKQDLSSLDVEIQTLEKGEAIISTLNIPFPVPARIHRYETYLDNLNQEGKFLEKERPLGGFNPPPD